MIKNQRSLAFLLVLASLFFVTHAQPASAGVIPADRGTIWNPGIPGGIPTDADATRPAVVWLPSGDPYGGYSVNPALGNNSTDARSAINSAITSAAAAASANSRRIVLLAPGTYRASGVINLGRSYVTLRGSGQRSTIINHVTSSDWAAISIGSTVGDFSSTPVVNVVGGAAKGATQITVANASGFNVGDILQIDQLADGTPDGPSGWVWILDSWWSLRSPYANYSGGGGLQGKFPDSPNGYRPISQRIEVLAKSGNTLTIHDPSTRRGSPLHVDFPAAMDPEVWRAAGGTTDVVRYTGLENLSVWSAAQDGNAKDMLVMNGAAYSWIKNVETDGSKNTWLGRHIHLQNAVYRCEVRESYSHNSANYNQGANAYGIIYSGSECLIEDNIVRELNKPVVGETSGGGNVIAYNYVDEAVIGSLTNSWQETAINMSHASFCHSDLFEGNHTPNVGVDSTHGNNGWGVIFRNYVTGRNSSGRTNTYLRAIYSDGWQREMTSVGNVLGAPTFNPTYQFLTPATGVNPVYGGVSSIYLLGSNAWELGTGRKPGADYMDDGQAAELFYRHLDYDNKTKSQYVNPSNPETELPDSLYLTGKPAFFGNLPWPWVDPGGATRTYTLPAKARYDGTPPPASYTLTVAKAGTGSGTVTSSPAGISCGSDCSEAYGSGTVVSLSQAAAAGSAFSGWSGACTGTGTCQVSMNAARSVTATFTLGSASYSLTVTKGGDGTGTVTSSPAGINCGADCAESYAAGTAVTLTPTPATGSVFAGWGGACTGAGTCQVTMSAARSVSASFALGMYTLTVTTAGDGGGTVTSSPAGIDCGSDCAEPYNRGTVVTLVAEAAAGSAFAGWGGSCSGTGSCQITLDTDRNVVATFSVPATSSTPGDFDGDGKPDLLWHNRATGELKVWLLDDAVMKAAPSLTPDRVADTAWEVRGLADLNADGHTDILWQHRRRGALRAWLMDRTSLVSRVDLAPEDLGSFAWQIRGLADFNGDGQADVLWHHQRSGTLYVRLMNGTTAVSGTYLTPVRNADTGWQIGGLADFNADGTADILWRHKRTGDLHVWFMKGTKAAGASDLVPARVPDVRWRIARIADFDGDGKLDILWHHQGTGALLVWYMNATTMVSRSSLVPGQMADTNWKVAPR